MMVDELLAYIKCFCLLLGIFVDSHVSVDVRVQLLYGIEVLAGDSLGCRLALCQRILQRRNRAVFMFHAVHRGYLLVGLDQLRRS